jgi:hypothetical protein
VPQARLAARTRALGPPHDSETGHWRGCTAPRPKRVGPDGILEMANHRGIEAEFGEQHAFSEQGAKIPTTLPIESIDDLDSAA